MQALENKGRWSWVKTYPLWDKARMDEAFDILEVGET
jgi:hypothetical protein